MERKEKRRNPAFKFLADEVKWDSETPNGNRPLFREGKDLNNMLWVNERRRRELRDTQAATILAIRLPIVPVAQPAVRIALARITFASVTFARITIAPVANFEAPGSAHRFGLLHKPSTGSGRRRRLLPPRAEDLPVGHECGKHHGDRDLKDTPKIVQPHRFGGVEGAGDVEDYVG